jgi:hypothetical protein
MLLRRGQSILVTPDDPLFRTLRAIEWPTLRDDYGEKITGVRKWNDLGQPVCLISPAALMPFLFGDVPPEVVLALPAHARLALRDCLRGLIPTTQSRAGTESSARPPSVARRFSIVAKAASA